MNFLSLSSAGAVGWGIVRTCNGGREAWSWESMVSSKLRLRVWLSSLEYLRHISIFFVLIGNCVRVWWCYWRVGSGSIFYERFSFTCDICLCNLSIVAPMQLHTVQQKWEPGLICLKKPWFMQFVHLWVSFSSLLWSRILLTGRLFHKRDLTGRNRYPSSFRPSSVPLPFLRPSVRHSAISKMPLS